jgi:hypothetical protein
MPLEEYICKKHDPETKATDQEIADNETWWATKHKLLTNVDTE